MAFAGQAPERRERVVEQHATSLLGLELATRQGQGMCTVPLVGRGDEQVLTESAHAGASQVVQASHIAKKAPYCEQHAREHQEVACWGHTQLHLRRDTSHAGVAPPQAMREEHLQAL